METYKPDTLILDNNGKTCVFVANDLRHMVCRVPFALPPGAGVGETMMVRFDEEKSAHHCRLLTPQLWANIQKQVDAREAAGEIDNENKEAFLSRYISLGTLITEV